MLYIEREELCMRFEIVGDNVKVTEAMRNQIEKKLSNLEKYLLIDENRDSEGYMPRSSKFSENRSHNSNKDWYLKKW